MVTRVPVSLGTIFGFSVKVGGKPSTEAATSSTPLAFGTPASVTSSSPALKNIFVLFLEKIAFLPKLFFLIFSNSVI